ncbi:UrcA family protein [Phenylobacterium terrae]|uniref:UrcA family protein n=1 Tax=Phenylobacterium terrae TaxID=2665495 RepID=A0ABW4N6X5_9CAUL
MPNPHKLVRSGALCALLTVGGLGVTAMPAAAQEVEEITVVGRFGPDGRPTTLSRVISYRDLDLTTQVGQDMLRQRIRDTARDLCTELGEPSRASPASPVPSCREQAERDAFSQMKIAVASATPRGPGWAPPAELAELDTAPPPAPPAAPAATEYAEPASATTRLITNGPVPDTPENRARYGAPMSRAGKMTAPAGN